MMKEEYTRQQIAEFRRDNLREIAETRGGNIYLVEKLGKSPSQISQWIGRRSQNYIKSKPLGNKLARAFEEKLGLPKYHLDKPPQEKKTDYQMPIADLGEQIDSLTTDSDGGLFMTPQAAEHFEKNYKNRTIVLCSDSGMRGKINIGDLMFCEKLDTFQGDGVYVISVDGHRYTRHVSKIPGTDNCMVKALDDMITDYEAQASNIHFLAKVHNIFNHNPL